MSGPQNRGPGGVPSDGADGERTGLPPGGRGESPRRKESSTNVRLWAKVRERLWVRAHGDEVLEGGAWNVTSLTEPTGGARADTDAEPMEKPPGSGRSAHPTSPAPALSPLGQPDEYRLACLHHSIFIPLINDVIEFLDTYMLFLCISSLQTGPAT